MDKKRIIFSAVSLSVIVFASACGSKADVSTDVSAIAAEADGTDHVKKNDTGTTIDRSKLFSDRDLRGDYDAAKCGSIVLSDTGCTTDSSNVAIDKSKVTITGEGEYIVSGTLSDGMIIVDVDKSEKVQLVLDGVDITSKSSAAIYVRKADKVFVTLADGTENILENGGVFEAIDENNIDAVIFSKDDLTFNGTGALTIKSPAAHGIVSKNELVITNGTYQITAASHGMTGKDNVAIADGSFNVAAGKDAIQSQNDEDDTLGFVYIADGDYLLSAGSDGINAINEICIEGGTIVVEKSEEGLEARLINITGGEIDITSSDDGINATDKRSGTASVEVADDSALEHMADWEAENRRPGGGPGQDAAGRGMDPQGGHGGFRGGINDTQSDANINISGGVIRIDAEGDGVDSNGYLTVSGGELYVAGPSNDGDGALDYGIDALISGGIVVAAGQRGMAQNFGTDSTQGAILVNTQQQNAAGSGIVLLDSEGNELVAWTMEKSYNSVVISCPQIKDGGSYTVKTDKVSTEITMDGLIYGSGFGPGGGRPEEMPGGMPEPPGHADNGNKGM